MLYKTGIFDGSSQTQPTSESDSSFEKQDKVPIMLMPAILLSFLFVYDVEGCSSKAMGSFKSALGNPCVKAEKLLSVKYRNNLNCDITRPSALDIYDKDPKVDFSDAKDGVKYTLFMLDGGKPGASIDGMTFKIQWMVNGTTKADLLREDFPKSTIAIPYARPRPTHKTKYLFVLFQEPTAGVEIPQERDEFNLEEFMTNNNVCFSAAMFRFKLLAS